MPYKLYVNSYNIN